MASDIEVTACLEKAAAMVDTQGIEQRATWVALFLENLEKQDTGLLRLRNGWLYEVSDSISERCRGEEWPKR